MKEKLTNGNLKIEEYSFHEFLSSFEGAVLEGYKLNLESNDTFPIKYGEYLSVVLVPSPDEQEVKAEAKPEVPKPELHLAQDEAEVSTLTKEPETKPRGRKSKV